MARDSTSGLAVEIGPPLPAEERVARWTEVMSSSGAVEVADPESFRGEISSRALGDVRTMHVSASRFRLFRDLRTARRVARDHIFINVILSGAMTGSIVGRAVEAGPGDLLTSRLANVLDILLDDAEWLALAVPRTLLTSHMRWRGALDGAVFPAGSTEAVLLGGLLKTLCAVEDGGSDFDTAVALRSATGVISTCLGGMDMPLASVVSKTTPAMVERFITGRLRDPRLGVDLICAHFGISRARLYRLMKEGSDIAGFIRRARLQAIARDIVSPSSTKTGLEAIARRWGFADARSFRRAFSREFGISPSELRRSGSAASLSSGAAGELKAWFG